MNVSYKKSVFSNAAKVSHLTYQIGESNLLREKSSEVDLNDLKSKKIKTVISKLKKNKQEHYKTNLIKLWKWIIPPTIVFSLLLVAKSYIFLDLIRGRP